MPKRSIINRILKIGLYAIVSIILLLIALILFIRSPWGQDIIVSNATTYVSDKTHTTVKIEKLYITFSGNVLLEKLFLDDLNGDTLIYSEHIEASIALVPLIFDQEIELDYLEWNGLRGNVSRGENAEIFNFSFLVDAFASPEDTIPSSSPPPKISIGQIHLSNIALVYNDKWLGIESSFELNQLSVEANEIELEKQFLDIEALKIEEGVLNFKQTKVQEETTEEEKGSLLPHFNIDDIAISGLQVNYQSVPEKMNTKFKIGELALNNTEVNLNKQSIQSNHFELNHSTIALLILTEKELEDTTVTRDFVWPEWKIDLQEISLADNNFKLQTSTQPNYKDSFNLENIVLTKINLQANNIQYSPENLVASLGSFSFKEQSNFKLNNLAFNLKLQPDQISISKLKILTPNNQVNGNINIAFNSFDEFLKNQGNVMVTANLPNFSLNPTDAFYFIPQLRKDTLLNAIAKNDLKGQLKIKGDFNHLKIPTIELQWGEFTQLSASGALDSLMDTKKLRFDLNDFTLNSNQKDILHFVDENEIGIKIPKQLQLTGNASGLIDDLMAKITLTIPEGEVKVDGKFKNKGQISFEGMLAANSLKIGKLIDNPQLGLITFQLDAKGEGKNLNSLNAQINSTIKKLQFNNYDYSNLKLVGDVKNGKGKLEASFKDYNLNTTLTSQFSLDTINPIIDVDWNVIGADLNGLKLTDKQLKTKFQVRVHFEKNENTLDLHSNLSEGIMIYDDESYSVGNIIVDAKSNTDTTTTKITSDFLNLDMVANSSYSKLFLVLENQISYYLNEEKELIADTIQLPDSIQMKLNLTLKESPIITTVLAEELEFEPIQLTLNFDQLNQQLNATLNAPVIRYQDNNVNNVSFSANGDKEDLQFSFGFSNLSSGPIDIPKTNLTGKINDSLTFLDFIVVDNEEQLMQVKSEIQLTDSNIIYHVNPEGLILNKTPWKILSNNQLQFSRNTILAEAFELKRNGQQVDIKTSTGQNNKEKLELIFNNFNLATITNFLNTEEAIASGIVNGNLAVENPTQEKGLVAKLEINDFKVLDILLGKLQLDAIAQKSELYKVDLSLKGNNVNLDINGDYTLGTTEGLLDFNFALHQLNLKAFEKVTTPYISDASGSLSSEATLKGTFEKPEYNGSINFKSTSFTVNSLNATFKLPDESITFTTKEIGFNDFLVKDSRDNLFHLDGKVFTESMLNPTFDLTLKANQFQVLNSTVEDNELFFGKVNLSTDLSIKGDLNIPIIRGQLSINENSNFTYVVPEEELDLMEREGVIIFVNKKNPDAILTRVEENESSSSVIKGYDLSTTLKVNKNVDFRIVVDQRSGDNLKIKGVGDFKLGLEPNGRTTLSGRYEVSDGYYEASLYSIVKRKFDIASGSSIVWSGNPLDAEMDIRAIYKIETSASSLMASKTSGQGIGVANEYNQKLPFWVYLNFDGELLKPKISFQLDMPESSQGELGGQVYARVQQLNNQEDELNKQVFSLLVLNQFFPSTSNDGTRGGSAALARGNVNKVLEDQLNNFSGKYLGKTGVELDFGVDSYTDYQGDSPQNKTQLDLNARKKLFNDKLIVQVGSGVSIEENSGANQQNTPVVGNVSLEYLMTENGRWRVKGFRKNEFESVIDGQLIITGIALIFQREFNQFSELIEEIKRNKKNQAEQDQ